MLSRPVALRCIALLRNMRNEQNAMRIDKQTGRRADGETEGHRDEETVRLTTDCRLQTTDKTQHVYRLCQTLTDERNETKRKGTQRNGEDEKEYEVCLQHWKVCYEKVSSMKCA